MATGTLEPGSRGLGLARIAIGVGQGAAAVALHQAYAFEVWPATDPPAFKALVLAAAYAPLVLLFGLGTLRWATLAAWSLVAAVMLGTLGWHDGARDLGIGSTPAEDVLPRFQVFVAAAAIVFIAHQLVAAADRSRRLVAPYALLFDLACRRAAQLALAGGFVGALWLSIVLGSELLKTIDVWFLAELAGEDWFHFPLSAVGFAAAIHLTEARLELVLGARRLGLTLLAWVAPLLIVLLTGFLIALPLMTKELSWALERTWPMMLWAAAALVVLVNAAYQDGEAGARPGLVLRAVARVAALLIAPVVGIAVVPLVMEIHEFGLSVGLVWAGVAALVCAWWGATYALAALGRSWLKHIEFANVVSAFLLLGVLIGLFTPIADPARISVADQLERLKRGEALVEDFDYAFLALRSARYGREALEVLRADRSTEEAASIADRAEAAIALDWRRRGSEEPAQEPAPVDVTRLETRPEGTELPADFVDQLAGLEGGVEGCGWESCQAMVLDVGDDGALDVVIVRGRAVSVYQRRERTWELAASGRLRHCAATDEALRAGDLQVREPVLNDLLIGGSRVELTSTQWGCG
jgi:hypothetical protein